MRHYDELLAANHPGLAIMPIAVLAQQAEDASSPGTLRELVITMQSRSEELQGVPITISNAEGPTLLQACVNHVANLSTITNGASVTVLDLPSFLDNLQILSGPQGTHFNKHIFTGALLPSSARTLSDYAEVKHFCGQLPRTNESGQRKGG